MKRLKEPDTETQEQVEAEKDPKAWCEDSCMPGTLADKIYPIPNVRYKPVRVFWERNLNSLKTIFCDSSL